MRKTVAILLVLLLAFVFISCNPDTPVVSDNSGYGSLSIVTEKESGSKTIEPDVLFRKCTSYEIFIKGLSLEYETSVITTSKSFVMEEVKAGEYEVYVEGVNESGVHVVSSEKKTVSIRNKTTTEVEFSLNRYTSGTGMFSLTMMVPKNDLQVYGVAWALKGLTDEDFAFIDLTTESFLSSDEKYRCYSINSSVPTGSYDIEVVMFNEEYNQVGFTHIDSVHVFKSSTASSAYIWDKEFFPAVSSPSFDLDEGVYSEGQIVRILSEDPRAELFYTLDGTEPTTESNLYVNPVVLTENTEIKAIAYVEGLRLSESVSRTYKVKVETPVFSIKDQSVVDYDDLEISTTTPEARIFYTLDGSTPSESKGNEYSAPILIKKNLTIKAIAVKENHEPSEIITAEYFDVNSPSSSRYFSITSNGAVSVNGSLTNLPKVLIIPEEINGIEVVSLAANAFRNCSSIKTVVIPNSVSSIGANAFTGCSSISSIDISEFITSIASTAFSGWTEGQIINDYSGLIRAGSLTNCSAKIYATIKMGTQSVGGYTGMDRLYGINLPDSVTTIKDSAFSGCVNLGDFVMPANVTSIGELAFNGCTSISQVVLPSSLKFISYDSFKNWTPNQKIIDESGLLALQRMTECYAKIYTTVPISINNVLVERIPTSLSKGRDDIYGLKIQSNIKYIEDYAFEGTSIEEITIPATVEGMGLEIFKGWNDSQKVHYIYNEAAISVHDTQTTFSGNTASFDVEFARNFTEIKDDAFAGMYGLTEVTIPDSVTRIGNRAFRNTSIRTVAFSDNVSYLGEKCFYDCSKLETISFGNSLKSIGVSAFESCNKLVSVVLPDSVEAIGDYIFANCALLESVNLGEGITSIPKYALYNSPHLSELIAPNCMGSFSLTVKLPLEQLIAKTVEVNIDSSYANNPCYSAILDRKHQSIEGGYRVFTFVVPSMPGIEYKAIITLKDFENNVVASYKSDSNPVTAGNATYVTKVFSISSLSSRSMSTPVFSKTAGTYVDGTVMEITAQDAEKIFYTLDGTTPTEFNGIEYVEPIVLDRTETLKAIGIREGFEYSSVKSSSYTVKVCTPKFSVEPGYTYPSIQSIEISSDTDGAELHYTLDGTTPNQNSPVYSEPLVISSTTTVKAIGYKNGLSASAVKSGVYTIVIPDHTIVTPVNYSLEITPSVDMDGDSISGPVTFSATLNPSNNNASYVWYLDGVVVSDESTYVVANGAIDDGYHSLELKAFVDGTSYSNLLVFGYSAYSVSISSSVEMTNNQINGAVTFTASLNHPSNNAATYSWRLDGTNVSTSQTYKLANGAVSNGNHSLELTVSVDGTSYSELLVFEYSAYAVSISPSVEMINNQIVGAVIFTANLNPSNNTATYKWYLDGTNVSNSRAYSVANGKIRNGNHSLQLKAFVDGTSYTTTLTFNYSAYTLSISPSVGMTNNQIYGAVSFTADFNHPSNDAVTYKWYLDGTSVSNSRTYNVANGAIRNGNHSLQLKASVDGTSYTATLTFNYSAYTLSISPSVEMADNQAIGDVTFTADLNPSNNAATYKWYLDGTNVSNSQTYGIVNGAVRNANHSLELKAIVDGSSYSDILVFDYSAYAVSISPSVEMTDNQIIGDVTFTANLNSSNNAATYRWYLDGEIVSTSQTYSIANGAISAGNHSLEIIASVDGTSCSDILVFEYSEYPISISPSVEMTDNQVIGVVTFTSDFNPSNNAATYRWYLDGEIVSTSQTYSIADGAISNGNHSLELTVNVDGTSYSGIFVFDYSAYTISISPTVGMTDNQAIGDVTFTANLNPSNNAATYRWCLDGEIVSSSRTYSIADGTVSDGNYSLELKAFVDGSSYSDILAFEYSAYAVSISPSVEMTDNQIIGNETFTAVFNYPSNNAATYKWYLDGEIVSTSQTYSIADGAISNGNHSLELIASVDGTSCSDILVFEYSAYSVSISSSAEMTNSQINGAVTFTANLNSSNNDATYMWCLDGTNVSTSRTYIIANGAIGDGNHSLELIATVDGCSLSKTMAFNYTKSCYTVDLNNQWRKRSVSNPNTALYDGVYESYSNYNQNSKTATMRIKVRGYTTFRIYVRSYAESTFDFVRVYYLDKDSSMPDSMMINTSGKQSSGTSISSYTAVDFTIPDDGQEHTITIDYRKDSSEHKNDDRGYVLIPKNQ